MLTPLMQLATTIYGSETSSAVIVLHGLFGSRENWHSVCQCLASAFRIIAVDLRNHGESPHSMEMDYPVMAEDVFELIRQENLGKVQVIGHSMGGKVAMQLALAHPTDIESMISVDVGPQAYGPRHQDILCALLGLHLEEFKTRTEIEAALAGHIPDLPTRRFLLKGLRREADGTFRWRTGLKEIEANYPHLNEAIQASEPFPGRALFVRGEYSDYIDNAELPVLQNLFPNAELATVPRAGHLIHVDQFDQLVAIVKSFLETKM